MDLTLLLNWLQSLGPYGYLLAAAVPVVLYLFRTKFGPVPLPATPTPPASPATNPLDLGPQFPLLNLLLQGLGIVKKGASGTTADIPHTLISQLSTEVEGVRQAHIEAHTAALSDLGAPATTPATPTATKT